MIQKRILYDISDLVFVEFLHSLLPTLAMYINLVLGVVNTFCEGTIILLIDRLTNINPIRVVVVVMVMVSPCESLLRQMRMPSST